MRRRLGALPSASDAVPGQVKDPTGTAVVGAFPPLPGLTAQDSTFNCRTACYCPRRKELKGSLFFNQIYSVYYSQ